MTWTIGSVTVADDEQVTKSGQAEALWDAATAEADPLPSLTPDRDWQGTQQAWEDAIKPVRLTILRERAKMCRWIATAIVGYATSNAVVNVTITPSDGGLQKDPASLDDTLPPGSDKNITGSLS